MGVALLFLHALIFFVAPGESFCYVMHEKVPTIEDFLHISKYDKRLRPMDDVETMNITTQLFLVTLGPIDEETFTYQISYWHRQWWHDPRLKVSSGTNSKKITITSSPEDLIWIPDVTIGNARDMEKFPGTVRTVIRPNGDVYLVKRMRATLTCQMDLQYYPMDTQKCPFILESYGYNSDNITLLWRKKSVTYKEEALQLSGYDVIKIESGRIFEPYHMPHGTEYWDNLIIHFVVKRTFLYYLYRAYAPTILLMILNMASYWIPYSAIPARVTLIVTTFLASALILQSTSEKIVKVSYTTAMQLFMMVNVTFLVAAVIEYLLVLYLEGRAKGKGDSQSRSETVKFNNFVNESAIVMRIKKCNITQQCLRKPKRRSHRRHLDDTLKLVMPISYFMFCVVYFGYYLRASKADVHSTWKD